MALDQYTQPAVAPNSNNPLWMFALKAGVSLVGAWVGIFAGVFLYWWSWVVGNALASYAKLFLAYLLAWPIFLIQLAFFGDVNHIGNFDPVLFRRLGWVAMWVYYYGLLALGIRILKRGRNKTAPRPD